MSDPVIAQFTAEFDRYHDLLLTQIDLCPSEEVWLSKTGVIPFWRHFMHAFGIVELYALPAGAPSRIPGYTFDEVRFKAEPQKAMTREEAKKLGAIMHTMAHEYMATQSTQTLALKNEGMTKLMGQDSTNIRALIGLIRHYTYHIGCIDSILRAHGIPGVL